MDVDFLSHDLFAVRRDPCAGRCRIRVDGRSAEPREKTLRPATGARA